MKKLLVIMAISAMFLQTVFAGEVILDNNCNRPNVSSYDTKTQIVHIPDVTINGQFAFSDVLLKLRGDGLFEFVDIREFDSNTDLIAREVCNTPEPAPIIEPIDSTDNTGGLSVRLPTDAAVNGMLVPIFVVFDTPIVKGDVLVIKSDGVVALELTTNGYPITEFDTRILSINGEFIVYVVRANGQINRMTHNINIGTPGYSPLYGDDSLEFMIRTNNTELKILGYNDMTANGYIKNIHFSGKYGYFDLKLTTKMPMNPYFGFISTKWLEDVNFVATH